MAKIIVFGLLDNSSLAHFYLKNDTEHEVVAFSVSSEYMTGIQKFEGLPVIPFEDVEKELPPSSHRFFAPMSYRKMNRLRADVYNQIKQKNYEMINYISSTAILAPGINIGENCLILEKTVIQPFVSIGSNVIIWSGAQISHHASIGDHVFLGAQAIISGHCKIDSYSFLGVNSSVREGIHIKEGVLVGISSSIIGETEPWSIYKGVPGKKDPVSSKNFGA